MALTPDRWIAIALAGFLLAPAVLLRDRDTVEWRPTEHDRLVERSRVAAMNLGRSVDQLRILQLRDSLAPVAMARGAPAMAIDAAFDQESRGLLASLVAEARDRQAEGAKIPATVFFILDTVSAVRGHLRGKRTRGALAVDYVLPTDSSHRCLVIARAHPVTTRRLYEAELRSRISRERLLGPCAYFESFGAPGRSVRRWLDDRGWQFAQRSVLSEPPIRWLDGTPDTSYRSRIDLEYVMGVSGRSCAGGRDEACMEALLSPSPRDDRRAALRLEEGIVSPGFFNPFVHGDNSWFAGSWPLGSREWTLLSDMARSLGPERFEQFWTSDLPIEQAFRTAAGFSAATWTREWIETTYHPQATGPSLPAGATGFAALLLIVSLGLTIIAARRRQMP
jgi:hypothetical protein